MRPTYRKVYAVCPNGHAFHPQTIQVDDERTLTCKRCGNVTKIKIEDTGTGPLEVHKEYVRK